MRRRVARVALALLVLLAPVGAAHACQACFGAKDSPLIDGAKLGALALVLVTCSVQGGFVWFFLTLRKRARDASRPELDIEWAQLQRSPGEHP